MAIDPKLVSIKKAGDLPSGIPTANGEFLYFEDETLKKAEMSDLYDRLESAYLGIITPSTTIPATGSWYGTVLAAGTFNNVSPAITVDAADFDVENGMANNEVRIIISEGVATKDVRRVKGDEGMSPYDVAVANGFVGTEAEWLESLKATVDGVVEEGNTEAVSGGEVYNKIEELESAAEIKIVRKKLPEILNLPKGVIAQENDGVLTIADSFGNILLKIDETGNIFNKQINKADILYDKVESLSSIQNSELIITDYEGNIVFSISEEGIIEFQELVELRPLIPFVKTLTKPDLTFYKSFVDDYNHVMVYGQSLAAGTGAYLVSDTQQYPNLFRFIGGVRTIDAIKSTDTFALQVDRKPTSPSGGLPVYGEFLESGDYFEQIDVDQLDWAYSSLVPLVEQRPRYNPVEVGGTITHYEYIREGVTELPGAKGNYNNDGETAVTGFAEFISKQLLGDGIDEPKLPFIIGSAPAFGSAGFSNFEPLDQEGQIHSDRIADHPNFNYFDILVSDVKRAKELADSEGKSYSLNSIMWIHETVRGTTTKWAKRNTLQLFYTINERVKGITNQPNDVIFLMHQSDISEIMSELEYEIGIETEPTVYSQADLDYIQTQPNPSIPEYDKNNCILASPIYPYDRVSQSSDLSVGDQTHLSGLGSKLLGSTMASVLKRSVVSESKYLPIHPINSRVIELTGEWIVEIQFHVPNPPLIIDSTAKRGTQISVDAIARGDKQGFVFNDGVGFIDIITDVEVFRGEFVRIRTNTNPTGLILHYCAEIVIGGKKMSLGNLKDSGGEFLSVDILGEEHKIENWSPRFKINL